MTIISTRVKMFFIMLWYGFHSEESYRHFIIHHQGEPKEWWDEFKTTEDYKFLSNFYRWSQLSKTMKVIRWFLCVSFIIATITILIFKS